MTLPQALYPLAGHPGLELSPGAVASSSTSESIFILTPSLEPECRVVVEESLGLYLFSRIRERSTALRSDWNCSCATESGVPTPSHGPQVQTPRQDSCRVSSKIAPCQ
jgi:hypothetical protein